MSKPMPLPLPVAFGAPTERADAARNREALLCAARQIVAAEGIDALTMDRLAASAGVGKGTVFRRFGSREGVMGALLNEHARAWQESVISGPPPLGPGAGPRERLIAFGASLFELNRSSTELIAAAGESVQRSYATESFIATHVRYLLRSAGVTGDLTLLAVALIAPLDRRILDQQVRIEHMDRDRILAGWADLVDRILA
ncbi:TetR family transcriptional regulator [Branchiibius hedensis]|uniref:DNA-binding transcriptional regulator, AcrR family n=1 Tax=Branchiibius hedensis TaxID=672460 RepID=A0A2Y9BU21_9MICO|nr:TetR/AcrR family transcriptional regulator [Branchiibius hedensis]PWJ26190.1 TetR family transcriptional regulator [Branchiibius hedensis]SSA35002.1 DNA-binding transcriptional regulator, AcrR family [Branchiibius hedensis]